MAVRIALLDIDGTLYEGSRAVPGAAAAVRRLRGSGLVLRFTSNTDSITPETLLARLVGLDLDVRSGEVVTPLLLAAQIFGDASPPARAALLASPEVRHLLVRHAAGPGERVTHVLVSDPAYGADFEQYDAAFRALRDGAQLLATHRNPYARRDDGDHLDAGGFVALLEYATGVEARVLGKPSPEFLRLALDEAGIPAEQAVVVGDDRSTDVAAGRAVGARTVLVRTGKAGGRSGPDPDDTIDSVGDLPGLLGL